MSGKRAKRLRHERYELGLPPNGRTVGHNFTDNIDNREDRRLKTFHTRQLAHQLRQSDPIAARTKASFWEKARLWLLSPAYRSGLDDPHNSERAQ